MAPLSSLTDTALVAETGERTTSLSKVLAGQSRRVYMVRLDPQQI
jgi:hypothetical protein